AAHPGERAWPAVTEVETLAVVGDSALVRARMRTGVMHQIRAHLALLGHPVLGDAVYGGPPAPLAPGRPAPHAAPREPAAGGPPRAPAPPRLDAADQAAAAFPLPPRGSLAVAHAEQRLFTLFGSSTRPSSRLWHTRRQDAQMK